MFSLLPTLPTYSEITNAASSYAQGIFGDMLPLVEIGMGLIIGGLVVAWLGNSIIDAVGNLFHKKDKYEE